MTHAAPGLHFALSKTGYTDSVISLIWVRDVFNPQTRTGAGTKPHILIYDVFGTHETPEVISFCHAKQYHLTSIAFAHVA